MAIRTSASCSARPFINTPSGYSSSNKFSKMIWGGANSAVREPDTRYMWRIGSTVYRAYSGKIYQLNNTTNIWEETDFYGFSDPDAAYIYGYQFWTDGTDFYYSNNDRGTQLVLNRETNKWEPKEWKGFKFLYGYNVWSDGVNTYYSQGSGQYILNGDTWEEKTWDAAPDYLEGSHIWTDGTNFYYSNQSRSEQYVLNGNTWEVKNWVGGSDLYSHYMWTDGTDIYCSWSKQYKLNRETSTWEEITWYNYLPIYGDYLWSNGTAIYHSYNSGSTQNHYVLLPTTAKLFLHYDGSNHEFGAIT